MSPEPEARLAATLDAVERMIAARETKRVELEAALGHRPADALEKAVVSVASAVPAPHRPEDEGERRIGERAPVLPARPEKARQDETRGALETREAETLDHLRRQTALLERIADALERPA